MVNKLEYLLIWNSIGGPPPLSQFTSIAQQSKDTTKQCIVEVLLGLGFCFELHENMPLWLSHHRTKDIWRRQMTIRKRRILRGQLFRRASPTGQLKLYISSKTQFINVRCFCECCFFSWIYPTGHLMPTYPLMCSEFHKFCSTLLICPSKARCLLLWQFHTNGIGQVPSASIVDTFCSSGQM